MGGRTRVMRLNEPDRPDGGRVGGRACSSVGVQAVASASLLETALLHYCTEGPGLAAPPSGLAEAQQGRCVIQRRPY